MKKIGGSTAKEAANHTGRRRKERKILARQLRGEYAGA
jgi:hypothetical protein